MKITSKLAKRQAQRFGFDGNLRELKMGLIVEQEHRDVVNDLDGWTQIALAHLEEKKNYYTMLKKVEA